MLDEGLWFPRSMLWSYLVGNILCGVFESWLSAKGHTHHVRGVWVGLYLRDEALRYLATVVLADHWAYILGKVSYLVGREKNSYAETRKENKKVTE